MKKRRLHDRDYYRKVEQLWKLSDKEVTKKEIETLCDSYGADFVEKSIYETVASMQAQSVTPLIKLFMKGFKYGLINRETTEQTAHNGNNKKKG